jgi:hypothetical protein
MSLTEAVQLLVGAPFHWWIAGGHALDLHVSESWRRHDDLDMGVRRDQAQLVYTWFSGWDLRIAARGQLKVWDGRPLLADSAENNVWVRRSPGEPWAIDVNIGEGTDSQWTYRRDPDLTRPWDHAVLQSASGVPYLAPDLQLLFKSKNIRPKDQQDAEMVIRGLSESEMEFLARHLPFAHPWQELIERR